MNLDPMLPQICAILREEHGCHCAILYGSRARGDETATSDYDVVGVRDKGEKIRDARFYNGVYLDLFVFPLQKIQAPDESHLYMRGGVVLFEHDNVGSEFLSKLDQIFAAGPKPIAADETQARKIWAKKSIERIRAGGIQGNFRRTEMLPVLLEDYFSHRVTWYQGPKESLRWLQQNDPKTYIAFEIALMPGAPLSSLEELIALVFA